MLEAIAIVASSEPQRVADDIAEEFPTIGIAFGSGGPPHVDDTEWDRRDFDVWNFDVALDDLARDPFTLRVAGARPEFPIEVLNRCQRHIGRRNRASRTTLFESALKLHRKLHDLSKPLVRSDFNHSLDVWQWVLRLVPSASVELQLAALFHDIERLRSEADRRVEHLATDYEQFKRSHARAGGAMAQSILADAGFSPAICARVAELVRDHEQPSTSDGEVALLNDADALSFFSLNSSGYADYFGRAQTRKKVAYTLARMSAAARAKLDSIHLRDDVASVLGILLASSAGGGK